MNPKKPKFKRIEQWRYKKLRGKGWRRPKGVHSKNRRNFGHKQPSPRIGYGNHKKERYMHPSGYYEVLVENARELEKVEKENQAVRFSSRLGKRKKGELYSRAREMGLKVLNPPQEA